MPAQTRVLKKSELRKLADSVFRLALFGLIGPEQRDAIYATLEAEEKKPLSKLPPSWKKRK